jgi:hypothetical protein
LFAGNAILLIPTVLTYFVSRDFMGLVTPWVVTVPGSTLLIAILFRRAGKSKVQVQGRTPWQFAQAEARR